MAKAILVLKNWTAVMNGLRAQYNAQQSSSVKRDYYPKYTLPTYFYPII
jgi:hypothetical protein